MSRQYLRSCKLLLGGQKQDLDLSALQVQFQIHQADMPVPNRAIVRVHNLSKDTLNSLQGEYQTLKLSVGYGPDRCELFHGEIRQFNAGLRENATDTYIEFVCQDGDEAYNYAWISRSFSAGSTAGDRIDALKDSFKTYGVAAGYEGVVPPGRLPRGKVLFGAAKHHLSQEADNAGVSWSIHNGALQLIPARGSLPDEAIVLNAQSGLLGLPQQTLNGITLRCLINPKIKYGGIIKLDNGAIQAADINIGLGSPPHIPGIDKDGLYRVYSIEHIGDTRGNDWYSDIVCVSVSALAPLSGPYIRAVANNG